MQREVISDKQGISLIILFIIGESSILASGLTAQQDLWVAIIVSMLLGLIMGLVYGRIFNFFPNESLFDIIEICFGKFIGKIIILLYTWYAFDLAALVLRDFGQFVNIVSFPETPLIVPTIIMMILCSWIVKDGIETMGRWSKLLVIVPYILTAISVLLLIPNMNLDNLRPFLSSGVRPIIEGTYEVFIYPFGETVIFIAAFCALQTKKSIYRIYTLGILIGGTFILLTSTVLIAVLGITRASNVYFSAYTTIARIDSINILQRIEVISAITFSLGIFIKVSIYLLASCKGIAKVLGFNDYRFMVIPFSLLVINLVYFQFDSIMSFNEWIFDVWIYFAFPFMVIFPIITLAIAEIKKKKQSQNNP